MPQPQQAQRNVIHLRLDEDLRERLQEAANARRFTLTNEVRVRLLDSLERDATRGLEDICHDMEINWLRYSARFLRLDLEDQLAEAIEQASDLQQVKTLARLWLKHRAGEQRALPRPDPQWTGRGFPKLSKKPIRRDVS